MDPLELIPLGAALVRDGLVRGTGGNLSAREGETILISASGTDLARLQPTSLVALTLAGRAVAAGGPKPSSEWMLHVAAYGARAEARVVIHAHPPQAIALGLIGEALPALTPDQYLHLGPSVPLVPYATPGSDALAGAVARALHEAPAVLLQNHGVLVTAPTPEKGQLRVALLEESCAIFLAAFAAGTPRPLSRTEMAALDQATGGRYRIERLP